MANDNHSTVVHSDHQELQRIVLKILHCHPQSYEERMQLPLPIERMKPNNVTNRTYDFVSKFLEKKK